MAKIQNVAWNLQMLIIVHFQIKKACKKELIITNKS